jgi:hypothetical protein
MSNMNFFLQFNPVFRCQYLNRALFCRALNAVRRLCALLAARKGRGRSAFVFCGQGRKNPPGSVFAENPENTKGEFARALFIFKSWRNPARITFQRRISWPIR